MLNPCLVFTSVLLCVYSFFVVDVSPVLGYGPHGKVQSSITAMNITIWSVYGFLLCMLLWSFVRIVFSSPGYVPKNYMYDEAKM